MATTLAGTRSDPRYQKFAVWQRQQFGQVPAQTGQPSIATSGQAPAYPTGTGQHPGSYPTYSAYNPTGGIQAPAAYQTTVQPTFPAATTTQPQQPLKPWQERDIARQQTWLGPQLSSQLSWNEPLTRQNLGLWQVGQQYVTQQQSEADRQRAYEELQRAWAGLGQSPESRKAKETAIEMLNPQAPWSPEVLNEQRATIRDSAAQGLQRAQQTLAEELARRGLSSSSVAGYQQAQLSQQAAHDVQQQIAQLNMQAQLENTQFVQQAKQQALAQLQQMASGEENQRLALDAAIANLFAGTERQPLDLSALAELIEKGKQPI